MIIDYNKPAPWGISVASELVVTGQNFEMADIDNPRGYTYGETFYIFSEDKDGYRRVFLEQQFTNKHDADMFAVGFDGWSPEADDWGYATPCYGSRAYIESGAEDDMIAMEREMEMY
jgi:hypothetical protein